MRSKGLSRLWEDLRERVRVPSLARRVDEANPFFHPPGLTDAADTLDDGGVPRAVERDRQLPVLVVQLLGVVVIVTSQFRRCSRTGSRARRNGGHRRDQRQVRRCRPGHLVGSSPRPGPTPATGFNTAFALAYRRSHIGSASILLLFILFYFLSFTRLYHPDIAEFAGKFSSIFFFPLLYFSCPRTRHDLRRKNALSFFFFLHCNTQEDGAERFSPVRQTERPL